MKFRELRKFCDTMESLNHIAKRVERNYSADEDLANEINEINIFNGLISWRLIKFLNQKGQELSDLAEKMLNQSFLDLEKKHIISNDRIMFFNVEDLINIFPENKKPEGLSEPYISVFKSESEGYIHFRPNNDMIDEIKNLVEFMRYSVIIFSDDGPKWADMVVDILIRSDHLNRKHVFACIASPEQDALKNDI